MQMRRLVDPIGGKTNNSPDSAPKGDGGKNI